MCVGCVRVCVCVWREREVFGSEVGVGMVCVCVRVCVCVCSFYNIMKRWSDHVPGFCFSCQYFI